MASHQRPFRYPIGTVVIVRSLRENIWYDATIIAHGYVFNPNDSGENHNEWYNVKYDGYNRRHNKWILLDEDKDRIRSEEEIVWQHNGNPQELFQCDIHGCEMDFDSRRGLNQHQPKIYIISKSS